MWKDCKLYSLFKFLIQTFYLNPMLWILNPQEINFVTVPFLNFLDLLLKKKQILNNVRKFRKLKYM